MELLKKRQRVDCWMLPFRSPRTMSFSHALDQEKILHKKALWGQQGSFKLGVHISLESTWTSSQKLFLVLDSMWFYIGVLRFFNPSWQPFWPKETPLGPLAHWMSLSHVWGTLDCHFGWLQPCHIFHSDHLTLQHWKHWSHQHSKIQTHYFTNNAHSCHHHDVQLQSLSAFLSQSQPCSIPTTTTLTCNPPSRFPCSFCRDSSYPSTNTTSSLMMLTPQTITTKSPLVQPPFNIQPCHDWMNNLMQSPWRLHSSSRQPAPRTWAPVNIPSLCTHSQPPTTWTAPLELTRQPPSSWYSSCSQPSSPSKPQYCQPCPATFIAAQQSFELCNEAMD